MTAPKNPSLPLTAWLPLQNAASAFREECSSLEQLVQELFADLDRLGVELETKADELEEGRRHLAERGRQLAEQRKESTRLCHQLEQQETQLTEALAELRQLRAEFAGRAANAAAAPSPESDALRQQLTELQVERAVLLERLSAVEQRPAGEGPVAGGSSLSAEAISGLAEQFAGQFAELKQHLQTNPPAEPAGSELDELRKERSELENELELVRARSAELQETVARQKRELSEQRIEVSDGLKELRTLIEEQSLLLAQHEPAVESSPSEEKSVRLSSHAAHEAPAGKADPVVNSVMAQFAKLQRDIAQRRKKK